MKTSEIRLSFILFLLFFFEPAQDSRKDAMKKYSPGVDVLTASFECLETGCWTSSSLDIWAIGGDKQQIAHRKHTGGGQKATSGLLN